MSNVNSTNKNANEPDSLITERDIDVNFGLFQEDSFPDALADQNQKEAINHALPKEDGDNEIKGSTEKELNSMADRYNKTEADIAYERYNKSGNIVPPEADIPVNDLGDPILATPVGLNDAVIEDSDSVLLNDKHLSKDIGLNHSYAPERDEVLESDAILIASAAGLTGSAIDYAEDDELVGESELDSEEEEYIPLEDVPDADDIEEDTPVDPSSPPLEIVHGTDLLNGSTGE